MLKIRHANGTDAEYAALGRLEQAVWPENPDSEAELRHRDAVWDHQYFRQRYIVRWNGDIVGVGVVCETPWSYEPGRYLMFAALFPQEQGRGLGAALYRHMLAELRPREPKPAELVAYTTERQPRAIRFLEERGFGRTMRWIVSELDVQAFAPEAWKTVVEKATAGKVVIRPLSELQAEDQQWGPKLYELDWETSQDEPSPTPMTRRPYAEYVKEYFESPSFDPHAWFIAVDGERYVGLTQLLVNRDKPREMRTGYTGVAAGYRHRGLATALKVSAIAYAKRRNVQTLTTGNEEHNPMYQINVKLGFTYRTATLSYRKELG